MKKLKILTVNGQNYEICDSQAARIDDGAVAAETTWSSQKMNSILGDVEASLDGILDLQNKLMGDGV